MERHRIALVGGGTRSGKSRFAVEYGKRLGTRRAFVATALPSDEETRARIERHRLDRGTAFETFEEPRQLGNLLKTLDGFDVVVIDCLTHWLSNLLLSKLSKDEILDEATRLGGVLRERRFSSVVVTNEVGMSVHPATELGRAFVELAGFAHQRLAAVADDHYLAVMGVVVRVEPVDLERVRGPA